MLLCWIPDGIRFRQCDGQRSLHDVWAAENAGVGLYCGEFGVIDQAPQPDTLRWFKDVKKVFAENHIGGAVWTYKEKDFGLIGEHYDSIRGEVISLWTQKR